MEVREIVSTFLCKYIAQTETANIEFVVNTLSKYCDQYILKIRDSESSIKSPLFNTSDFELIKEVIKHPNTTTEVASKLFDLFYLLVFTDKFNEYNTLSYAMILIV